MTSTSRDQAASRKRPRERSPPVPDSAGWGVPDWRDPAAPYPAANELSLPEWRWEFVRRNPVYRWDWLQPPEEFQHCSRQSHFAMVHGVIVPVDPRRSIGDLPSVRLSPGGRGTEISSESRLFDRAPFLDNLVSLRAERSRGRHLIVREPLIPPAQHMWLFLLGLTEAERAELDRLLVWYCQRPDDWHKRLRGVAPGRARLQQDLWPLYLRMLDAKDAGTSHQERASILPATMTRSPQRASAVLKAAEELRRRWRH